MSEIEKRELLETIKHMKPEDKAFVTGYAAGVAAKAEEAAQESPEQQTEKPA